MFISEQLYSTKVSNVTVNQLSARLQAWLHYEVCCYYRA